jgi:hypothetical protein
MSAPVFHLVGVLGYAMFSISSWWGGFVFSRHKAPLKCFLLIDRCVGVAWWLQVFRCIFCVRPLWNKSNKSHLHLSMRRLELHLLIKKPEMQTPLIIRKLLYFTKNKHKETLCLFGWMNTSFNAEAFAMVPLAWTTHVQGWSHFSFTYCLIYFHEFLFLHKLLTYLLENKS